MLEKKDFWHPGAFIKHLAEKRGIAQRRAVVVENDYEVHTLDLTGLQLNVSSFTPFVVNKRMSALKTITGHQIVEILPALRELRGRSDASFCVLVVGGTIEERPANFYQDLKDAGAAVIDQPAMTNILDTGDKKETLNRLAGPLLPLGRDLLSPYVAGRIATGGRFFGREQMFGENVLGKLGGNFTFMGNRRIGKTSLLKEIKRRLLLNDERLRTAEVYGNNCHTTYDVVKRILDHIRPELANRMAQDSSIVDGLPNHLDALANNIVIFVDELDSILDFDARQNYQLLNLLRAASESDRCRIFFAGFRRVMEAKKNLDTPLHNFTSFVKIGGLSREETNNMIRIPLSRLGINLDATLPATIQRETGGHPELIQLFCRNIIDYFRECNKPPTTNELLYLVSVDDNFRTMVYGTFLKNTNAHEKLLCFCLFRRIASEGAIVDGYEFTAKECDEALKTAGRNLSHNDLETLTQNLRVAGVFADVKGAVNRYRFAVPRLVEYSASHDLDWSILKAKEEIVSGSETISLHAEPDGAHDDDV